MKRPKPLKEREQCPSCHQPIMTVSERVCARIAKRRIERGMVQRELGELAGLDETQISRTERGAVSPRIETLEKIAIALEVDVSYFFERD